MAYVSQEMKKELAGGIKAVLKKYGMKGSIAVDNHSSLVVNLKEGAIDFEGQAGVDARGEKMGYQASDGGFYNQVNTYHISKFFSDVAKEFLEELLAAMKAPVTDSYSGKKVGWYDNSDSMIDYFDIKYYCNINVGKWNKGYVYNG